MQLIIGDHSNLLQVTWSKFLFTRSTSELNDDETFGPTPVVERLTRWELYALVFNLACVSPHIFTGVTELALQSFPSGTHFHLSVFDISCS
jgi:hypothetical protein